jgi:hypothetical protein
MSKNSNNSTYALMMHVGRRRQTATASRCVSDYVTKGWVQSEDCLHARTGYSRQPMPHPRCAQRRRRRPQQQQQQQQQQQRLRLSCSRSSVAVESSAKSGHAEEGASAIRETRRRAERSALRASTHACERRRSVDPDDVVIRSHRLTNAV